MESKSDGSAGAGRTDGGVVGQVPPHANVPGDPDHHGALQPPDQRLCVAVVFVLVEQVLGQLADLGLCDHRPKGNCEPTACGRPDCEQLQRRPWCEGSGRVCGGGVWAAPCKAG